MCVFLESKFFWLFQNIFYLKNKKQSFNALICFFFIEDESFLNFICIYMSE